MISRHGFSWLYMLLLAGVLTLGCNQSPSEPEDPGVDPPTDPIDPGDPGTPTADYTGVWIGTVTNPFTSQEYELRITVLASSNHSGLAQIEMRDIVEWTDTTPNDSWTNPDPFSPASHDTLLVGEEAIRNEWEVSYGGEEWVEEDGQFSPLIGSNWDMGWITGYLITLRNDLQPPQEVTRYLHYQLSEPAPTITGTLNAETNIGSGTIVLHLADTDSTIYSHAFGNSISFTFNVVR